MLNKILSKYVDISYVDTTTGRVLVEIHDPNLIPAAGDTVEYAGIEYKIVEMVWSIRPECPNDSIVAKLVKKENEIVSRCKWP